MKKRRLVESKSLGIMIKEEIASELDRLVASLPADQRTIRRKALASKSETEADRTEVSVITTDSVDLEGDVVLPDGIDLTYYQRNPVVCLAHDMNTEVGKALWVKPDGNGLKAKTHYPERPEWYQGEWLPDQVFALISAGLMQGKSIGFLAKSRRSPLPEELTTNPDWEGATVIDSCVLLEYSCCVAGLNPDAVVSKGLTLNWERFGMKRPGRKQSVYDRIAGLDWDSLISEELDWLRGKV